MRHLNLSLFLCFTSFLFVLNYEAPLVFALESPCGDWIAYKDEKCYKILDGIPRTFEDAKSACAKLDLEHNTPILPVIHTKEEQDFLSNFLFNTSKKADNFWIGSKYSVNAFKWIDNTNVDYTNWVALHPKNRTNYCIQIQSEEETLGKWIDEPCEKNNAVVCQKLQTWSLFRLQNSFLDVRKELRDSLESANKKNTDLKQNLDDANKKIADLKVNLQNSDKTILDLKQNHESSDKKIADLKVNLQNSDKTILDLKQNLENSNKKIAELKQNEIPIGFVYTQLPNEKTPSEIWPWMSWSDVSATFAGVFFRVNGGGSEPFGSTQNENAPRLIHVQRRYQGYTYTEDLELNVNSVTNWIYTGDDVTDGKAVSHSISLRFITSGGEIRPRNMAIRVWRRTA